MFTKQEFETICDECNHTLRAHYPQDKCKVKDCSCRSFKEVKDNDNSPTH